MFDRVYELFHKTFIIGNETLDNENDNLGRNTNR